MTVGPWCIRAIEAAFRVQQNIDRFDKLLGSKTRAGWCAEGLKDAIERLRKKNSSYYGWLEILPIVHRYHTSSTFTFTYNKYEKEFKTAAHACLMHIDGHRTKLAALPPVPIRKPKKPTTKPQVLTQAVGGAVKDASGNNDVPPIPKPQHGNTAQMALEDQDVTEYRLPIDGWLKKNSASTLWIDNLFHYATSLDLVCWLLKYFQDHPHASDGLLRRALVGAFKWIGSFPWEEIKELNQLAAALEEQPLLRTPAVVTNILNNDKSDGVCDKKGGLLKVLNLLRFCLAVPVPTAKDPSNPTAQEQDAHFGSAISATKGWFHRRHGSDDDDDDDDDKSSGSSSLGWTSTYYSSHRKPKKTPAERKVCADAISNIHSVLWCFVLKLKLCWCCPIHYSGSPYCACFLGYLRNRLSLSTHPLLCCQPPANDL